MRVRASKRLYREKDSSRQWGRRGEPQPRAAGLAEHDCQHGSARRSRILRAASPSRVPRAASQATQSHERRPNKRGPSSAQVAAARARPRAEDFMNPPAIHDDHASWHIESTARLPRQVQAWKALRSWKRGKARGRAQDRYKTGPYMMAPALKGREGRSV